MKKSTEKRKKLLGKIKIYGIITIGSLVASLGINVFLAPLNIVAGGVSGIAIIVNALTGFPMGLLMLCINIPLFFVGLKLLGSGFGIRSLYGAVAFSVFTDLTGALPMITQEPLLAALMGGALLGLGMGSVFLTGATTGGTDVAARLGHKLVKAIDVGKWLFIFDFIIITLSGILFNNYELCLYGVIALVVNSYLIDMMIQGANFAKLVYIISPKYEEIARGILNGMERGVTGIVARGMYQNDEKMMLMCVVKKFEIQKLEKIVETVDPHAFIIFTQARQVTGEGFKIYPVN